jgi:nucleoid-associated protein YgaU
MHSIERYGIVALLFLVVTVVAVLMWDGGKKQKLEPMPGSNPAPVVDAGAPRALDRASRLDLVAQGQPGPLVRETPVVAPAAVEPSAARPVGNDVAAEPFEAPASLLQPGEEFAPEPQPIANLPEAVPAGRTYVVKGGDTLSEIAQRELGSARRWQEIVALNPGLDPARLRAGKELRLPGGAGAPRAAASKPTTTAKTTPTEKTKVEKTPVVAGASTHKVGKGESLWKIAERTLGDGKRWREIAALNPKVNPDKLVAGTVLKLPAGGGSSSAPRASEAPKAKKEPVVAAVADERPARRGSKVK